jgi:hypothetical protein
MMIFLVLLLMLVECYHVVSFKQYPVTLSPSFSSLFAFKPDPLSRPYDFFVEAKSPLKLTPELQQKVDEKIGNELKKVNGNVLNSVHVMLKVHMYDVTSSYFSRLFFLLRLTFSCLS